MSGASYDVLVIGGGIHGAGVAQAAAAAGYRTLVLEKTRIAAGTSSRSSKLIHGGLRYLESAQLGLVRESLYERALLLRLAPDLVRLVPFHIPIYPQTSRRPWMIRAGLMLYSVLGGGTQQTRFVSLARRQWDDLDGLSTRNLQKVFRYFDAQTDDAALTRAVMRSAQSLGAGLACPARFVAAQQTADGYQVDYIHDGQEITCQARTVVNAAGPWVSEVGRQFSPAQPVQAMHLVQGSHILLHGKVTNGIYYVEAPADRRAVFVMPWYDRTLVGTTEARYTGDPALVQPQPGEIAYLQETLRNYFPARSHEVMDSFAGLRVLPNGTGPTFHRPRETCLVADNARSPRAISIYGGKLTGYRATGSKVVRALRASLPQPKAVADTTQLILTPE